jgi:hypothetical protein
MGSYCELFQERRPEVIQGDEPVSDERCSNGAYFDKKLESCICLQGFNGDRCEKVIFKIL